MACEIISVDFFLLALVERDRVLDDGHDLSLGQVIGQLFEFVWCEYRVRWVANFTHSHDILGFMTVDNLIIRPWAQIILDGCLILSTKRHVQLFLTNQFQQLLLHPVVNHCNSRLGLWWQEALNHTPASPKNHR